MWRVFLNAGISKGKYVFKNCKKLIGIALLNWLFFRPENNKKKWYTKTESMTEKNNGFHVVVIKKMFCSGINFSKLFSLAYVPGFE